MLRALLAIFLICAGTLAHAQGNYTVRAGDELVIEVIEDPSLNRTVLVLPDGKISFPFAGALQASGRTTSQIARAIASGIAENFASPPNVFVSVEGIFDEELITEGFDRIDVYLIGQVVEPGLKQVDKGTTLLQFLAETGGFTRFAATKRIQLRRIDRKTGRSQLYEFNYRALANGKVLTQDLSLVNGDVVVVPERRLFE